MGEWTMPNGIRLTGVHDKRNCRGRACVVHHPTKHHMRKWTLHWRSDRGIFERICPHGIGHPDPDQYDYWREIGAEYEGVHGCDSCCTPPEQYGFWKSFTRLLGR